MKIALAADHAGFHLKQRLASHLVERGLEPIDLGTHSTEPVDYPDYAEALARCIHQGLAERGILVCGSGVGAAIAANKIPGIRAGLCHDCYSARQGVEHDDMNVLVLGGRVIGEALAWELAQAFLAGRFSGEPRHCRRLAKIAALEQAARGGATGQQGDAASAPGSAPPPDPEPPSRTRRRKTRN